MTSITNSSKQILRSRYYRIVLKAEPADYRWVTAGSTGLYRCWSSWTPEPHRQHRRLSVRMWSLHILFAPSVVGHASSVNQTPRAWIDRSAHSPAKEQVNQISLSPSVGGRALWRVGFKPSQANLSMNFSRSRETLVLHGQNACP